MKARERWFVSMFIFLSISLSQPAKAQAQPSDEAAINRVLDQLEECYLKEDMNLLSSLVSDAGFILLAEKPADPSNALLLNKPQLLDVTAKRWAAEDFIEHKHINRRITIKGPVAKSISALRDKTGAGKEWETPIFHIFAKEDGQWKLVFTSSSLGNEQPPSLGGSMR